MKERKKETIANETHAQRKIEGTEAQRKHTCKLLIKRKGQQMNLKRQM